MILMTGGGIYHFKKRNKLWEGTKKTNINKTTKHNTTDIDIIAEISVRRARKGSYSSINNNNHNKLTYGNFCYHNRPISCALFY